MYEDYAEHDRVKFKASDENDDGKLSKEEFPFFMYPEQHEFMAKHVVGVSVTEHVYSSWQYVWGYVATSWYLQLLHKIWAGMRVLGLCAPIHITYIYSTLSPLLFEI